MRKLTWAIALFPLIATAAAVNFLPDKVPMHYNASGMIDRWGSKYEMFGLPVICLIMTAFFEIMAYSSDKAADSPKRQRSKVRTPEAARLNAKTMRKMNTIFGSSICVLQIFMLIKGCAEGRAGIEYLELDTLKFCAVFWGITIVIASNFLPKTRRNGVIGFRCTWSLYNDTTWQKSNRFAATTMIVAGISTVVSSAFVDGLALTVLMIAYITVALIISMVYAKRVYDEVKAKEAETE